MSAVLAYRDICVIDNAISADEQRHIVLLAGSSSPGRMLMGVGITLSATTLVNSDVSQKLYQAFVAPLWERYFKHDPQSLYPHYWVAPDLQLLTLEQHRARFGERRRLTRWDPRTSTVALGDGTEPIADSTGFNSGAVSLPGGGASGQGAYGSGPAVIYPHAPRREISYPRVDIGPIEWVNPRQTYFGRDRYH